MQNFFTNLGKKIKEILTSKRMVATYWHSGAMIGAVGADIILEQFAAWNPNDFITIAVGLIIAQITKYLNTKKAENPLPENN